MIPASLTITTPRLILRPFTGADIDPMAVIFSDPETMRFIGERRPRNREQTEKRIQQSMRDYERLGMGLLAVTRRDDGELIGRCGLQPLPDTPHIEIGWLIARSHWRQGYAYEAAAATLDWGFTQRHLNEIRAVTIPENESSVRLIAKLGFREKGRGHYYGVDMLEFILSASDWHGRLRQSPVATG